MMDATTTNRTRRIPRRYKLLAWLLLVLASQYVRHRQDDQARPAVHQQIIAMSAFAGDIFTDERVDMAYRDARPDQLTDAPVVLVLHGSPLRPGELDGLVAALRTGHRVIVPDLPGFGRSTRRLPDYSFVAHAAYVEKLVEALALTNLHIVAHSQGVGVGLELYQRVPGAIRSMTFVSGIGVQEFELMGLYGLNRAIYGVQWVLLEAAAVLVPHFGWLDRLMFNTAYARNFYDADLRPLRGYLAGLPCPLLLLHGRDDILVPLGTAQETHRLVPQSELLVERAGHGLMRDRSGWVADHVATFVAQVEQGLARGRERAEPARVEKAGQPFNRDDVDQAVGVAMVVMMILIALATFVSEDLACIGAGLLAAQGIIDYPAAAGGAFIGIFIGDLLLFWAGHHWGKAALKRAPLKWMIKENALHESSKWFARKGPVVILLSRFVPGSRLPTYFSAGMLHTRFWLFFMFFLFAGLVWAPLLVWLSMEIGQQIIETLFTYKLYTLAAIAATAVLLWLMFHIVIPLFSFKGRRLLLSRWRRLSRWEFWPSWVIYPPVLAYLLGLGVRHRSLTLFTAANPGIPLSGVVGESKKAILDGLSQRRDLVARYELIPRAATPADQEAAVLNFLDRNGLSFPVVLKPDAGQRGLGVAIARKVADVARYFESARPDTLVQEYVPGFEFGVFYYRIPGQPRGHVFSITEKRFPSVVGDGRQDLEHLILRDPRAVCMAPYYLRLMDDRRYMVPAEEETVQLVELGTHCRGAVFYDGRWIKTIELERAVDELCQGFEGFNFGRFDIRTTSLDDFRSGRGFKVIELNGVTSESTNIYDPGNGLFDAYAVLFRQWRIAYKIGERNRRAGVAPASLKELLRAVAAYESAPEA